MRRIVINLRNLLGAVVLTFAVINILNVNDINAKTKPVVNTKSMVIYEQTEQQIETNLKNTTKTKQSISYKITEGKDNINVVKDGSDYYINGIKPGNGKVKITVKTVKKVDTKNKKGKIVKKKKTSKKSYTIKIKVIPDDHALTDELLFNKITNGIKSAPKFKINNFDKIEWNIKNKSAMNALDYLYSHLDHKFKRRLWGFEYTYVESEEDKTDFESSSGGVMGFIQYKSEGYICDLPEDFMEWLVVGYSVDLNFKNKEIEDAYNESPYVNDSRIEFKRYFVYYICDKYYSMLDKSLRNEIDPYNDALWHKLVNPNFPYEIFIFDYFI